MKHWPDFMRGLALAALADWLITRTLTRAAIFMPKSPPVIVVYQAVSYIGQLASTLAGLLALAAVGWIVWRCSQARGGWGLPVTWLSLLALSLVFLFDPPAGWLAVSFRLLVLAAIATAGQRLVSNNLKHETRLAGLIPALALLAGGLYQLGPAVYEALRWPGPAPLTGALFNVGELLVVLSPLALWSAYGRGASRGTWVAAALPALAFTVMHFVNPAMTGILAIWSIGLTLYLPWPLYTASLWLAGVLVIVSLRRGDAAGWAVLLLASGGYAPQTSTQTFLGLIAVWLLAAQAAQPATSHSTARGGLPCPSDWVPQNS